MEIVRTVLTIKLISSNKKDVGIFIRLLPISFEIGLAGYPCRVWVEEPPESKMTVYDIYREEVMMKESVKNYEAAREHLTRLLKENGS